MPTNVDNSLSGGTSGGSFNVDDDTSGSNPGGPGTVPTPQPMGIVQSNTPFVKPVNNINVSSGGGGGGGIGSALGAVGSILGALFNQGGMVGGLAGGGPTDGLNQDGSYGPNNTLEPGPDIAKNNAMALGYLVGALHQRDFHGTPDTLQKAGQAIQQMLMQKMGKPQDHFASGGSVASSPVQGVMPSQMDTNEQGIAKQAIDQVLGLQPQQAQPKPAMVNQTINTPPPAPMPNQANMQQSQGFVDPMMSPANAPMQNQANQANMQQPKQMGFAAGGPGMMMPPNGPPDASGAPPDAGPPPLKPGQPFMGDGSVKGPGGPTDDLIPAKLSNGEFVMSSAATQFFGVDKLNKMNEQGKQGFMQAKAQVQANQPGAQAPPQPNAPPAAPPSMPPSPGGQPPQMQAKGGPMMQQNRGYMGL